MFMLRVPLVFIHWKAVKVHSCFTIEKALVLKPKGFTKTLGLPPSSSLLADLARG